VVSGLARGVDTAAHIGALGGSTVGVIASGIDIAFPPENEALQEKIANDQLLIAEQPPGSEPLARHFPSRNRIIAGLAARSARRSAHAGLQPADPRERDIDPDGGRCVGGGWPDRYAAGARTCARLRGSAYW
jgi:hypothetical protein